MVKSTVRHNERDDFAQPASKQERRKECELHEMIKLLFIF